MLNQKLTGAGSAEKTYVEDVFSTYLYTGTGAAQTINNGIDLAGKGGMVWIKDRTSAYRHNLFDTSRGITKYLDTSSTFAENGVPGGVYTDNLTAFNSNGFTLGADTTSWWVNHSPDKYTSWTFRKAPKFFDVVTFTGGSPATVSHSLGSTPGMIIVKATGVTDGWYVWHRSASGDMYLNTTAAAPAYYNWFADVTSTNFKFYADAGNACVAYLFAHDTTTDGLIQCGSFTTPASGNTPINLGWEPQYLLMKASSTTSQWNIHDNMRGVVTGGNDAYLLANTVAAEASLDFVEFNATGFTPNTTNLGADTTYIYMAIRRPMKVPTDGTKVFQPVAYTSDNIDYRVINTGITTDMVMTRPRAISGASTLGTLFADRLRGNYFLGSAVTNLELADSDTFMNPVIGYGNSFSNQLGYSVGNDLTYDLNYLTQTVISWTFQRAPGFFDVVCYTGTGSNSSQPHNLGVAPELILEKTRNGTGDWQVTYNSNNNLLAGKLNTTAAFVNYGSVPGYYTSTQFGCNNYSSGVTSVNYLFASCPGVSKVFSFTGNGTNQTINCGFTNGARFVMLKRTDSTGDWFVWDTARGIVAGTDPHLSLNTTAAEVTSDDTIDPDSTGFIINQVSATNVNVNGATYIGLAIA